MYRGGPQTKIAMSFVVRLCVLTGYAVSSGHYFDNSTLYYALGIPRAHLSGRVCLWILQLVKYQS